MAVQEIERVVVRFAGDSGDGMQLVGTQLTNTSALIGNDIATFPDFPSEIRAPAGTLPGVSGFQVHIGHADIRTPGDKPDVLVAMNPAALKVALPDMVRGTTIIVNGDEFTALKLKKAKWDHNPLDTDELSSFNLVSAPVTDLTLTALQDTDLTKASKERCKNFFALGMIYWLYDRPLEPTIRWVQAKFRKKPELAEANALVLKAGHAYAETVEALQASYKIAPASHMKPGEYRQVNGNQAIALGLVAAATRAGQPLFYGSYPITPASDILHALAQLKAYDVITFQAEDEIAGCGVAIGAAYAGQIAVTGTSGPGVCLKAEMLGLAVMVELPLVIVNVQRGGPSTGLPTKTEQSDLLQAFFCRNGESPMIILAPATPADCFDMAYEAVRLATKFMTPCFVMSDGYLANGSEPWRIPNEADLAPVTISYRTDPEGFSPYMRDENLVRPWVKLGTPGMTHRVGGLEKEEITGDVNMQPDNHQRMTEIRAEKIAKVADHIPDLETMGAESGELLVLGWGSTYGAIHMAVVEHNRSHATKIAAAHLRYLNPMPKNTADVLSRYSRVLIPELNMGQLSFIMRGRFPGTEILELHKVKGRPFMVSELVEAFAAELQGGAK